MKSKNRLLNWFSANNIYNTYRKHILYLQIVMFMPQPISTVQKQNGPISTNDTLMSFHQQNGKVIKHK